MFKVLPEDGSKRLGEKLQRWVNRWEYTD